MAGRVSAVQVGGPLGNVYIAGIRRQFVSPAACDSGLRGLGIHLRFPHRLDAIQEGLVGCPPLALCPWWLRCH